MGIEEGKVDGDRAITPANGKKTGFRLRMLIPPGQKVPVGIAS